MGDKLKYKKIYSVSDSSTGSATPTLSEVLTAGNLTGDQSIYSNDSASALILTSGVAKCVYDDGLYLNGLVAQSGTTSINNGTTNVLLDSGGNIYFTGNPVGDIEGSAISGIVASVEVNLDSAVTLSPQQFIRIGPVVTVSGRFTANPTAPATATSFEGPLPIASDITAISDVSGVAFCGSIAGMGAEVIGVIANNTFKIQWISSDITSQDWSYTFTYRIN